ncbi:MAG TPA: prolyl oligopeptidase family serine peptidase [Candidatus Baltobacteraceae bacterium]|nr:prolyl oligopeptidase family serine peptidase [Candidatus Baltobacteraceae bacterium]
MRSRVAAATAAFVLSAATAALAALPPAPVAKKVPVRDTYFGQTVVDPYRWMETPGNPDLLAFLKAHNDRTRAILDSMPGRAGLVARLRELADTTNVSSGVVVHHGTYFYEKLPPGANSTKLYVRGTDGVERVLVDPDAMSGPRVAISGFLPSNDGSRVAVVLAPGGSENGVLHVVDVKSGAMLADAADRADFGAVSWSDDDRTVYYLRRQALNPGDPPVAKYLNVRTYGHVVGTPAANDVAVFGAGVDPAVPIPPTTFAVFATSTESPYVAGLLIAGVDRFATVYVAPKSALGEPATIPWRRVIAHDDLVTNAAMHGDTIYALTAKNAPRFRLVSFKVGQTFADAKDVIPAGTRVIDNAATAGDAVYVQSREDGLGRITRVAYDGTRTEIPLPVNGTIAGLATEFDRPGFLLQLESWTESPRWYAYDPASGTLRDTKLDPPSPVDYSGVVADEVRVPARDGVMIPLSVIHRRDMKLDGSNPTMLYAYGSYGISSDPSFSAGRLAFLERGGIIAVAHVRGGGEYGEEWHLAGKDANKINTIGDFIDCAKWMIAQRYTSPAKLGARGGSAGGITMGGAITRDPADFAAVLDEIPVSDQLRIETSPNGPPNVPEFGSVTTEQGFKNLYATSAVHHVVPGTRYPAVMLTTGINDPRVDPWQAAKMAATLQDANAGPRPILLRVDYNGGHGLIGGTKSQAVDLAADEYSFLLWQFGDPAFQPRGM